MSTGSYYFTIHYFPACSPSNTTLKRILPIFLFSLLLPNELETVSLFQYQSKEESCFGIAQVTFGTSTGHFWHFDGQLLFYYLLLFSSPQPVQYYFVTTISQLFPFSLLHPKEFETFSLFQYQSKEESCFGIAQVNFGTSTGHSWHVDGSLLARRRVTFGIAEVTFGTSTGHSWHVDGSLLTCRRAVTVLLFTIFQPAARPILLWKGFRHFFPFLYCLKLSLSSNTNLKRNLVLASRRSLLARRRVTFGTSTGHFWHVDGQLLFYSARSPSNTTLKRVSPFFSPFPSY